MIADRTVHHTDGVLAPFNCHYVDDGPELYDLRADPWEVHNLAGRPASAAPEAALRRLLLERTIEAGGPR